jgi:predicted  nucleic acid-binding Zn-ribbon protein
LDRRNAIEELRRRIRHSEAEALGLLQHLGEYLSYQPAESLARTPLSDVHKRIGELREKLPETRQQVKRILQNVARSEELEKSIRSARAKMTELQEEEDQICEEIGRAAFEAYRSSRPADPQYESVFAPLLKQEQELAGLESEMEKAESAGKSGNFFRIFRESGRTLYVKGLLSLKKKHLTRAYRETGHRFCESGLATETPDPELERTLQPYSENRKRRAELAEEIESLRERHEGIWQELRDLGADRSHHRRVREIEHQIERIEEELEATFGSLGQMYRAKPIKAFAEDPEIRKILRQVARTEKEVEQDRRQITRIEAAIQMESLEKQVAAMNDRVERLGREIKSRQEEVRSVGQRIKEAQEQRGRLEAVRGPEDTLLNLRPRKLDRDEEKEGSE